MPYLTFRRANFVASIDPMYPNMLYTCEKYTTEPVIKVDLGDAAGPICFRLTRFGCQDRGVPFSEYRPDQWLEQGKMNSLRIRFYCCSPSVRTKRMKKNKGDED